MGRAALYFQSLDGETSGYWNAADDAWMTLDTEHNRDLAQALLAEARSNFERRQKENQPLVSTTEHNQAEIDRLAKQLDDLVRYI